MLLTGGRDQIALPDFQRTMTFRLFPIGLITLPNGLRSSILSANADLNTPCRVVINLLICVVDSESGFWYEIQYDQLIYHAWLQLQQSTEVDATGYTLATEHDGEYLVIINAETGIVEDVVYDSMLNENG